jgi:hypothetical protein
MLVYKFQEKDIQIYRRLTSRKFSAPMLLREVKPEDLEWASVFSEPKDEDFDDGMVKP